MHVGKSLNTQISEKVLSTGKETRKLNFKDLYMTSWAKLFKTPTPLSHRDEKQLVIKYSFFALLAHCYYIPQKNITIVIVKQYCFCHKMPLNGPMSPQKLNLVFKVKLLKTLQQFTADIQTCHLKLIAIFHLF